MKYSSEFNYPSPSATIDIAAGLNPDDRFPRFGPWVIYPLASSGSPNPMEREDAYIDSGGAGLGLSIVSAVVGAHGGNVKVKQTSGGGATFEVELPLASASN